MDENKVEVTKEVLAVSDETMSKLIKGYSRNAYINGVADGLMTAGFIAGTMIIGSAAIGGIAALACTINNEVKKKKASKVVDICCCECTGCCENCDIFEEDDANGSESVQQ